MPLEIKPLQRPCQNLRCKEMFYKDNVWDDEISSGHFWCVKTQHLIGPDGKVVGREECSMGRECFID
jgi:hypothetical protein